MEEALRIDRENRNSDWHDAINAEMPKIIDAVEKFHGDISQLSDYQEMKGHMIFDIKLGENFRRKARFVADGHLTDPPSSVTYSTVVARDSVRICLTTAALNDLDILAADVENAYLKAPCREKVWLRAEAEFGHLKGTPLIVKQALYGGLKSSGASFCACLDDIGFKIQN